MPLSSPPTTGDDVITMTGTEATVDLLAGNDTFTVDTGDEVTGDVLMGLGADTFNILDGIVNRLLLGTLFGGDTDTNTANLDLTSFLPCNRRIWVNCCHRIER